MGSRVSWDFKVQQELLEHRVFKGREAQEVQVAKVTRVIKGQEM
jgi:hypothetical protein